MNPIDLIRLQITLEYALDDAGRLVLYGYMMDNHASKVLARSFLGVWYADVVCNS